MTYDVSGVLRVECDGPVRVVTLESARGAQRLDDELHDRFGALWAQIDATSRCGRSC